MFEIITGEAGSVSVSTTSHRGSTPEEIAERALDKILYIGSNAHPALRDQAEAFKDNLRSVLVYYMRDAIRANNVTLENKFRKVGHEDLIPILYS